jgi:hypothetical protein
VISTIKEVQLEIEKMIKKIEKIQTSIEDAFDKGIIDFDEITGELEEIKNELQSRGITSDSESSKRHLLKTGDLSEGKKLVTTGDYR